MLRTKFKYWAIVPLITALALIVLLYVFIILLSNDFPIFGYFMISGLLILIVWLIFVEMKNKVVSISIEGDLIKSTKLLGFGRQATIQFNEVSGYKTCSIPAEWDSSEVLYLVVNNKKMVRLSEFYHQNYRELKTFFTKRFRNLGEEGYNLFT